MDEKERVNPTEDVIYRKFDSDDVIRLRSKTVVANVQDGKEKLSVDTGKLQKYSIILGVKSCPWFSDKINESEGVTEEAFKRRETQEFRKIPVDKMDKLFRESQEFNKADYDIKELRKN